MSDIKFGTDGWRAKIGDDYTFANLRRCAQGFAEYLKANGQEGSVVVGYDRRFLADQFAAAAAEVLAGNGFKVYLTDTATPTPVISFSVGATGSLGAVNITASHNPPEDCGFKVRDENGGAIAPDGLTQIESLIPDAGDTDAIKSMKMSDALDSGDVEIFDPKPKYLDRVAELIDVQPIKDAGLTVVVDDMWGNGSGWLTEILGGGQTEIIEIHAERNPIFPEMSRPGADSAQRGMQALPPVSSTGRTASASWTATRTAAALETKTATLSTSCAFTVCSLTTCSKCAASAARLSKTLSTTTMLDKLGKLYGVDVVNTGVGFKYVAPAMIEHDAMIGGEESGGYAFRGHVPERDGIVANLYLLDLIVKTGKKADRAAAAAL